MALSDPLIGSLTLLDLIVFIIFFVILAVISKASYSAVRWYLDRRVSKKASKGFARLVQYSILVMGLYIGFVVLLEQDISSLFVSLGIISLAVALASQQVLGNAFAGMLIAASKPYELEDWVEIGGLPITGLAKVRDIGLMFTEFRDLDGRIVVVPNSFLLANKVINYTKGGFVSLNVTMHLSPESDLEKVFKVVYNVADIDEDILPNLKGDERTAFIRQLELPNIRSILGDRPDLKMFDPKVNVVSVEKSRVKVNIRIWIKDPQRRETITSKFLLELRSRFASENIEMADS
ncbi:MAG: Large-conductance mechanosensitive channel MscMJLR [Methanomassiliicoccales archaeon PtaU1.Bin124]|nr:MAG: Large-conductance mechanosensitive channel MscMJLR [Methanomassiliicoccales archaeon PtaU1.Bin124]